MSRLRRPPAVTTVIEPYSAVSRRQKDRAMHQEYRFFPVDKAVMTPEFAYRIVW